MRYIVQKKHLDRLVMTVWLQRSVITNLIFWLIDGSLFACSIFFAWPHFINLIAGILAGLILLHFVLFVIIFPPIRYRTFFYAIRHEDLLIQEGVLIIRQTVIPFTRVQNVETEQGPLLRKHDLTAVRVTTAAGATEIPALSETEALSLRDKISELIKENAANEV